MNEYSMELMHHGVMGMHWGVRRYQKYGEGGYDPDHKGRFIGKVSKGERKGASDGRAERKEERREEKNKKAYDKLDYKYIMKHPEQFSTEEINAAAMKAKAVNSLADEMSSAKGRNFLKKANMWNTAATAAKATVGVGTAVMSTALMAITLSEKMNRAIPLT